LPALACAELVGARVTEGAPAVLGRFVAFLLRLKTARWWPRVCGALLLLGGASCGRIGFDLQIEESRASGGATANGPPDAASGGASGMVDGGAGADSAGTTGRGETDSGMGTPNEPDASTEMPADSGVDACVKRVCGQAGTACGLVEDGCGGMLDCSDCGPGYVCDAQNECELVDECAGPRAGALVCEGFESGLSSPVFAPNCDRRRSGSVRRLTSHWDALRFRTPPAARPRQLRWQASNRYRPYRYPFHK
jgi:hypothetical protein